MTLVAIITGAGRGIGRATAIELSASGFDVVLVSRTREQLDSVAREIKTRALVLVADVADPAAMQRVVDETIKPFGRLDAIVNNAGHAPMTSIEQTSVESWRETIEANLSSAFYLTKAAWPHLKKSGGAVVNVSSEASRDPFENFTSYGPAKAGLDNFTKIIHRQGKPHGIRAYAVAPSMTETKMLRDLLDGAEPPLEQILKPEEVARVIASCIAGELRYCSGEVIWVHKT